MPHYYRLGTIPKKRHVQFRRPDGVLYSEELFGTEGFVGPTSTMYHINPPTQVYGWKTLYSTKTTFVEADVMRMRHVKSAPLAPKGDAITGRVVLFGNADVEMALCNPAEQMGYHYKNGQGDECLFIHFGSGVCHTMMGALRFGPKDYVIIPKGVIYRLTWDDAKSGGRVAGGQSRGVEETHGKWKPAGAPESWTADAMPLGKYLLIETMNSSHIGPPPRYVSKTTSQFLEHSPYCERDLRLPVHEPEDGLAMFTHEYGEYEVRVKARDQMHTYMYHYHPLDIVGWDGCYYPYAFNIEDFAPITGKLHMPPPIHQTFEAHNFVICSFCPRMLDWHAQAIKVPYNHSNIDSDEVLYYVEGNFGSRKGIEIGSLTLHPQGIPHGPHPGTIEASMQHAYTGELAVMCDTFRPLFPTKAALGLEDMKYPASWEGEHFPRLAKGEKIGGNFRDGPVELAAPLVRAKFGDMVDGYDNTIKPMIIAGNGNGVAPVPHSANGASVNGGGGNVWAPNSGGGADGKSGKGSPVLGE
ncbi:homogentisate 1,2-dioxygenase [soil metagenome]